MIENKECKHFHQHYGYSRKDKTLHKIFYAHCLLNIKNKTCENCEFFEQKEDNEELQVINIIQSLKRVEKNLSEVKNVIKKLDL